ncbi:MAG: bifunctional proline dehydrogenase/L-glutamate gamma-semialdehyde dehydrogenase PutA [Rhodobacteraceae bacterium]|nr:bifunctional proline dehydrogenase/L-glutamate gamma-semialdehyde dehydrogenase PutA [Paracoccaceae bacterium]
MSDLRAAIRNAIRPDETAALLRLIKQADLSLNQRRDIANSAAGLVRDIRSHAKPGIMEVFLEEYGLSTDEGIALMCLAEALLRVPDADTIDALIEDKIAPGNWGKHLGKSSSSLVNASTWALLLTGKVLDESQGITGLLRGMVKRIGEPVIRRAVGRAMREMGRQFVLGRDIPEALKRAGIAEKDGYTYSYDMLGEAAITKADAAKYQKAYADAIATVSDQCTDADIRNNPGISIKLSALHPRYEYSQRDRVLAELAPRVLQLAQQAKAGNMGFNIDAEEAARLDLSLDVIELVLSDKSLQGWHGFGVVIQAYGPRAAYVIDWLHALAKRLDRRIMVRLVKGAYWDTEIKLAQVEGLDGYPVFTRKVSTDISYIACARQLLQLNDRIYPQFATHNAHTVAAILHMAKTEDSFEFQRLHGMGEALHDTVHSREKTRCRIYAPVGAHRDLLAYLVRRLLENGANSSFVNQIVDADIAPEIVAADPFLQAEAFLGNAANPKIAAPCEIFAPRENSSGYDITDPQVVAHITKSRAVFANTLWQAGPLMVSENTNGTRLEITNPALPTQQVGVVIEASPEDSKTAIRDAKPWQASPQTRADILRKAAELLEQNSAEFYALLAREAGKTLADAIGELREAVDFMRYYADEIQNLKQPALGVIACISPWNFPLAIFCGQISAGLAAGNAVIAKPAEATPIIGFRMVQILHQAGVPKAALQYLPGQGAVIGAALSGNPRINGICFTGSTATAQHINRSMAKNLSPFAPLIAETGGINAMIVDSTSLFEQATRDVIISAFQSAGQRCSALRILYVQQDIFADFKTMLIGAMAELKQADPWQIDTDIGPVIDATARQKISEYIELARADGRVLFESHPETDGNFISPSLIGINGIADLDEEVFGPVLHIATFTSDEIDTVVDAINASQYGLTFGLHSRIDDRVQQITSRICAGNIYVNRNQIGATVGSQPFGGEGLSGTGPKAGGPHYLGRLTQAKQQDISTLGPVSNNVQNTINQLSKPEQNQPVHTAAMPGPTGESNRLSAYPRGVILCLGPDMNSAKQQKSEAQAQGCQAVIALGICDFSQLHGFDGVVYWGDVDCAREIRISLASRDGPLIPLIFEKNTPARYHIERHICIDTTASGGNTSLLAAS